MKKEIAIQMAKDREMQAKGRVAYYFRLIAEQAGVRWDSDNDAEVSSIVDFVLEAAMYQQQATNAGPLEVCAKREETMDWADKEADRIVEEYYGAPGVTPQDLKGVIGVALRDAQNKAFEKCIKRAEQEAEGVKAMDDYPMKGSSGVALEIASAIRAFAPQEGGYVPPDSNRYNVS